MRLVLSVAVAAMAVTGLAVPAGAASELTQYSATTSVVETGAVSESESPCGVAGTVTFDQRISAAGAATIAGLTDAEFLALVQDDPEGLLRQVTITATGAATLVLGGHTYIGTFTQRFGGKFLPNGMYFQTGTFSLRATSETGTLLLAEGGGHTVDGFDGLTKMFTDHGKVTGCLP